jgi:hypothetical protein
MTQSATSSSAAIAGLPNCWSGSARVRQHAESPNGRRITRWFAADPGRARRFSTFSDDLWLDFAQSAIDDTALDTRFALASTADLAGLRPPLFRLSASAGAPSAEKTRAEKTRAEKTRVEKTRAEQTRAAHTSAEKSRHDSSIPALIQGFLTLPGDA